MPGEPESMSELAAGGVSDPQQAAKLAEQAKAFKQAGQAGKFAIDPEHGKHLIKKLNHALNRLSGQQHMVDSRVVQFRLPLGTSPDGEAVANFFEYVTGGGEGCKQWAHKVGRQALIDARDGVEACMKHYRAAEQDAEDRMRGLADGT